MREIELLNALALKKPGIEIRVCQGYKVSVRTHYDPKVVGIGDTLFQAAVDCARWILDVLKDHPELKETIPEVLAAFEAYDEHSQCLQV
jgi:hypothetical protein